MRPMFLYAALACATAGLCQTPAPVPAACGVFAPDQHFPAYVTDSESHLKAEIPALKGIKFAGSKDADESSATLDQAGAAVMAMLPRIPNLVADEALAQIALPLPYTVSETSRDASGSPGGRTRYSGPQVSTESHALKGEDLDKVIHGMLIAKPQHTVFSYRIHPTSDPAHGTVLEEFRTDSDNASVDIGNLSPGNPRGTGFSNSWLMLVPANRPQARFRFLGHQKMDGHDTVVLAFAQIPDHVRLPAEIGIAGGDSCPFYTQGVLWIDPTVSHLVRLQTDLLAPISGVHLNQMRSDVHFSEVRIPERNLSLRLPTEVEITWQTETSAGGELHRYSNYRLFTATSKIITKLPD